MRAEVPGELHRRRPAGPRSAVDDEAGALADFRHPQVPERLQGAVDDRSGLLEGHPRGHVRHQAAFPHADVLRVGAPARAEDAVSDPVLAHRRADRLDLACELRAEDLPLRAKETGEEAPEERLRRTNVAVRLIDRRRVDLDEDLVVVRHRPRDLFDPQYFRRPVPVVNNRSHGPVSPLPFIVRTTFPVFCPVSTYFVASTTSSNG